MHFPKRVRSFPFDGRRLVSRNKSVLGYRRPYRFPGRGKASFVAVKRGEKSGTFCPDSAATDRASASLRSAMQKPIRACAPRGENDECDRKF
jgi:hypothetical protein